MTKYNTPYLHNHVDLSFTLNPAPAHLVPLSYEPLCDLFVYLPPSVNLAHTFVQLSARLVSEQFCTCTLLRITALVVSGILKIMRGIIVCKSEVVCI